MAVWTSNPFEIGWNASCSIDGMEGGDEANNSDWNAFESIGAMLWGYVLSFTEIRRKKYPIWRMKGEKEL